MRRDLLTSLIAVVLLTVVFGLAYPLAFTGVAQVLFPGKADGSKIDRERQASSAPSLIAQDFRKPVPSKRQAKVDANGNPVSPDRATSSRGPRRPATTHRSPSSATSGPTARTSATRSRRTSPPTWSSSGPTTRT